MTNVYLNDSDEEAIMDFMKEHEGKTTTSEHFEDKARN